jgi:hypothetical protein
METYQTLPPVRTKTGRISKALKGRPVHQCFQCGKVAELVPLCAASGLTYR